MYRFSRGSSLILSPTFTKSGTWMTAPVSRVAGFITFETVSPFTPGSVSAMLKKLDELGLITHVPYRGVRLTADGRRLALEVIRHHRLLERFLADTLGMPWDRVHAEAEVLEHVLSEDVEQLIADKLGHPTVDPHGDPIPNAELELEERATRSMESLRPGDRGT